VEQPSKRILLVDDDRAIRKMYSDLLEKAGFEVVAEASAIDALERITEGETFDLVVTDIMMARMDGWEFLRVLRQDLGFDSVTLPVIVVSAHFDSDILRAEAFKRGASSTFTKAEPLSRLLNEVRIHSGCMRSKFDDDTNPG
jgi:CheY-like chemotaxis protein